MKNNVIMMREEEMEVAVRDMEKCYNGMDTTSSEVPQKFSNLKSAGLFDMGINTISNQLNSLTTSIFNVKNVVNKRSNEMFNMDRKMAKIAEKIEIPQDFVKNNSMQANTFNQVLLEKLDGRTVNEGQELKPIDEVADSIVKNRVLGDITSNLTPKEEHIDTTTSINKENMNNINKSQDLNQQNIDEKTKITKTLINNINNMQDLLRQELEKNTNINKQNLKSFSNNGTLNNQNLGEINVNKVEKLEDISNGKNTPTVDPYIGEQFDKVFSAVNNLKNDSLNG